jgi:hypothetical protein
MGRVSHHARSCCHSGVLDGDGLGGLVWVLLAVFLAIGVVVGLGVALVAFLVYRVIRPRPGLRGATAVVSVVTAGFALLAGQLVRLAVTGSITEKGQRWLPVAVAGCAAGVAVLSRIAVRSRRTARERV